MPRKGESFENERWYDYPIGHMVAGPCPVCLRDHRIRNTCPHQLPFALGYVFATFNIDANGKVTEDLSW